MSKKTDDKIKAVRSVLDALPAKSPTAYETLAANLDQILEAKKQRYTNREIVDQLKTAGVVLSLGTFQTYLQKAMREAGIAPLSNRGRPRTVTGATPKRNQENKPPAPAATAVPVAKPAAEAPPAEPAGDKGGKVSLSHNPNRKL